MADAVWHDLGPVDELKRTPLRQVTIGRTPIALSYADGTFGAVSGVCNHAGGPLGDGRLDGEFVVCPWHNWKFHRVKGHGEPGFEEDQIPRHELKEEGGRLLVNLTPAVRRHKKPHPPHALERKLDRAPGPVRVLGLSTTNMDRGNPRYSTSEALLATALAHAHETLQVETKLLRLTDLRIRPCEGYYSKSAHACTWPCSITQMDPKDQMDQVYEGLVFWGDVILIAMPIRWGAAGSLFFRMAERLNCVQNQVTIRNRVMLRNKVASFIITGGQDNVQAVAGHAMMFFAELGCLFPQFPFIAHSRGWEAEDMEHNVAFVREHTDLHDGARELVERAVMMSKIVLEHAAEPDKMSRAGRKASAGAMGG